MSLQLPVLSFDDFVQLQVAAAQSVSTSPLDLSPGSPLLAAIEATSFICLTIQNQIVSILQTERLATSSGNDVDTFVNDFGLTREPGVAASTQVVFSRYDTTNPSLVPVGALLKSTDGTLAYTVVADSTQAAYSAAQGAYLAQSGASTLTATVQCSTVGAAGNVGQGAISVIASNVNDWTSVSNASAVQNGADPESDSALKSRFVAYLAALSRGTVAAIQYAIESVQPNLTYRVLENTAPDGSALDGFFTAVVDDGSGAPSSDLLARITTAVAAVVPVNDTARFAVIAPTVLSASVAMSLTVQAGYTKSLIQSAIVASITQYVDALPVGSPLPYSVLGKMAWDSASGIQNVTNLTLNGGTADLGGGPAQVVKISSVVVD